MCWQFQHYSFSDENLPRIEEYFAAVNIILCVSIIKVLKTVYSMIKKFDSKHVKLVKKL